MRWEALAFAEAAEELVGTPFRFRGRDRATGLDCVGLVLAALADIGRQPAEVGGYAMRQLDPSRHFEVALDCGFRPVTRGPVLVGDLLLARPGPLQVHLLVGGRNRTYIHSHAGLGRVVRSPAPCPWPLDRRWRLADD